MKISQSSTLIPGSPELLGAHWDGAGVNFALFSAHAERVVLCLFTADGTREERFPLPARTGDIWHGYLPGARPGIRYGYRVAGPYEPAAGFCFNANKLLIDPYARALTGPVLWNDANFGYRTDDPNQIHTLDTRDNAAFIPKAIVSDPGPASTPLGTPWANTILYELHVKGFTWRHPGVPEADRGRLKGLAAPAVLEYLRALGISAIELLPIFPFADETHLARLGLVNYWGYNPYNFFAVEPRYGTSADLHALVAACHDAGLEVILDVVFNHTAEGNALGPTLSLRGIDDRSYYWRDASGRYVDFSGCGNTLNVTHPQVQRLIVDCLSAWATLGIDGFRFDLASVLGRRPDGFASDAPLLKALTETPALRACKLIAEPWDIGGYHLGQFPQPWAQWNDRFRNTLRDFWRGGDVPAAEVATRLAGSSDLLPVPTASVNFITSHDGFTLEDVVSYAHKHNESNGESNCDGMNENFSSNWGTEGPSADAEILATRGRVKRALLASLLVAQGIPMILAGDEFGRSQRGNNNAYCQDNPTNWLDWSHPDAELLADVRRLIAMRKRHPRLRREAFFAGIFQQNGFKDITWLHPDGREIAPVEWTQRQAFGFLLERDLIVLLNPADAVAFHLPAESWRPTFDSAGQRSTTVAKIYDLAAHSLVILEPA